MITYHQNTLIGRIHGESLVPASRFSDGIPCSKTCIPIVYSIQNYAALIVSDILEFTTIKDIKLKLRN